MTVTVRHDGDRITALKVDIKHNGERERILVAEKGRDIRIADDHAGAVLPRGDGIVVGASVRAYLIGIDLLRVGEDVLRLSVCKDKGEERAAVCTVRIRCRGDGEAFAENGDTGEVLIAEVARKNVFARGIGAWDIKAEDEGFVDEGLQVPCRAAEMVIVVLLAGALDERERVCRVLTDICAPAIKGDEQRQQQEGDAADRQQQPYG